MKLYFIFINDKNQKVWQWQVLAWMIDIKILIHSQWENKPVLLVKLKTSPKKLCLYALGSTYNNSHDIVNNWWKLETTQISISNSVDIKMDAYSTFLITSLHTQLPKSCQASISLSALPYP